MVRFPPAETARKHQKIVQRASRLFRKSGFSAVSIGDVMRAAELTHGSFYNHFESREALLSECVDHVAGLAVKQIEDAAPTIAGRKQFAANYLSLNNRDAPDRGCLLSSLGAEIAREPSVKPSMTRYVRTFVSAIASHFPWNKARARSEAIRMTASLVGALLLARAVDDEKLSREILDEVAKQYG